jgi:Glycosyltransferase Family 4
MPALGTRKNLGFMAGHPSKADSADGPLRVVHVYKDVHPPVAGGIEKYIDTVRRAMPDVASHVLVGARRPRTSIRRASTGVELAVAEFGRALSVPLAPTFPLWLRRIEADIVHVHMPNPLGEAAALLSLGNRWLVVSFHADIVRQKSFMPLYRPLVHACLDRASAVVVGNGHSLRGRHFDI